MKKTFKVTFIDYVRGETLQEAYENFMPYIRECSKYSDIDAIKFEEMKEQDGD